jgi:hexulose-6-phosphate isomerase
MKKAISAWCFPGKSTKEMLDIAKDAGYDGIELALEESGETGLDSTEAKWKEIRAYADKLGLSIHSIATGLHWHYPLTADDEAVREKGVKIIEKQLDMANVMGAEAILVVPGAVHAIYVEGFKVVPYDVAYERSMAAFMRVKGKAESLKIRIGVENVWNKFLLSPLEMRDFIDKIDSPYVGAYIDVGNVLSTGFPEQWIRILGKRICKVHFKDFRTEAGGLYGFVDLLAGEVDWPAVMEAFKEVGYDGWATAEMIPPYTHHSDLIVYNTCAAMKRIIGEV